LWIAGEGQGARRSAPIELRDARPSATLVAFYFGARPDSSTLTMTLLAIDTSGDACSAALLRDGHLEQCLELAPRRHGELILGMMQGLLDAAGIGLADLAAIAFGCGPGSFTGVRIACSVAQGAAFGAGLPTVPVSTLAALAQGEYRRTGQRRLLAALDARMGEVYWGAFEIDPDGIARPRCVELVGAPDAIPLPEGAGWLGVGSGWSAYSDALHERLGDALAGVSPDGICEAGDIAVLGAAAARAGDLVQAELARPVYLRDRVAERAR
jgi:tRNA threonylcarbamoyladenosine biosynthesis protein TsaB